MSLVSSSLLPAENYTLTRSPTVSSHKLSHTHTPPSQPPNHSFVCRKSLPNGYSFSDLYSKQTCNRTLVQNHPTSCSHNHSSLYVSVLSSMHVTYTNPHISCPSSPFDNVTNNPSNYTASCNGPYNLTCSYDEKFTANRRTQRRRTTPYQPSTI